MEATVGFFEEGIAVIFFTKRQLLRFLKIVYYFRKKGQWKY